MSIQIFKKQVPNELLFELFDALCVKSTKHYVFNVIAFKKGVYTETIQKFLETCVPYYHISKRKYLEKPLTYKTFTTVLRQICNYNKVQYTTQIRYDKSTYEIVYYIYFI